MQRKDNAPRIRIAPVEGSPNRYIAACRSEALNATFSVVFQENVSGAVALHSFIFVMPVSGVLLGGLVLGEPITHNILLALFFIVSGILVVNSKTKKYAPLFPSRGV